jgi:hypothetical protein
MKTGIDMSSFYLARDPVTVKVRDDLVYKGLPKVLWNRLCQVATLPSNLSQTQQSALKFLTKPVYGILWVPLTRFSS